MLVLCKRWRVSGLYVVCLIVGGALVSGCNMPHTPDAVVGNQATKNPFITGAKSDGTGRVTSNPSTGAGDRKGLGN